MESIKLNAEEIVRKHCLLVGKVVPHRVQVTNSEIAIHAHWIEQLGKWIAKSRNKFLPVAGWGCLQKTKGRK